MSMQQVHSTWTIILPYLQVSLGVWQILKFTPLVGIIQGVIGWLLWPLHPPVFPSHTLLRDFPGRVFKKVKCVRLPSSDVMVDKSQATDSTDSQATLSMWYLGEKFSLKKDGNKLFVDDEMSHYISNRHWENIIQLNNGCFKDEEIYDRKLNQPVFVEGYTKYWEKTVLGNVMTFDQVLDCYICTQTRIWVSHDVDFLPVDLTEQPEEIISKLLNLVGLFFQAKKNKFHWYYPTFFSIASAVLQLPLLASRIYLKIKKVFVSSVQCICDILPYSMRRFVYSLDMWVDNLRPCNDIQLKVVRGNIDLVIGGAAKTNEQYLTPLQFVQCLPIEKTTENTEHPQKFDCDGSIVIEALYMDKQKQCKATLKHTNSKTLDIRVFVYCEDWGEFKRICTFLSCVADTKAGSLKSYDQKKKKVVGRSFRESVLHYVAAGLPDVYTLKLYDVTM